MLQIILNVINIGIFLLFFRYTYNTHPKQQVHYRELLINNNGYGTMPQAGIDPPAQSHASYEASALPPSHHG